MKPVSLISTGVLLLLLGAITPTYAQEEQHGQEAKPEKQEQQAKPAKQEEQAKAPKQEQQAKPAKPEQQAKPEKQQQAKAAKPEQQAKPEKQQQAKAAKPEQQAKPEKQQQAKAAKPEQQAKPEKQQQAKAAKPEQQAKPEKQQQAKAARPEQQQQAKGQQGQQHPQRSAADEQRQRSQPALRLSSRTQTRIPDDRFRSNFGREHRFRIGSPRIVGGYSRFQYGGFWFGFLEPWPEGWYYTDDVYVDYVDGGYYLYNPNYPGARIAITVYVE